jgi:heat shock protein HslJ
MKHLKIATFLFVIFTLTGISAAAQDRDLAGVRWELTRVNNRTVVNSPVFIEIEAGSRRFTGNTGCNQMFGPVRINGGRITFSNVGTTRRMCKMMPGSIPENTIIRSLENTVSYRINGRVLTFYDRRGRIEMQFRRDAEQRTERTGLEGRKWMLEAIGTRRTLVAISDAFVVFDERKRSAGGDSGCNAYGGSYTARNSTISITDVISTMRACEQGNRMEVERSLFDGLRRANRYDIRDGRLFLYRGSDLLLTFRGERK